MKNSYRFFCNVDCKYFPCHKVEDESEFNCLFCYCPLYMLGENCGGRFTYTNGVKNCINCIIPHRPQGYNYITKKLREYINQRKREEK